MKSFIKAVVVASVLMSANAAFATISKASSNGSSSVVCPHKLDVGLHAVTAVGQQAAAGATTVKTINGKSVQ